MNQQNFDFLLNIAEYMEGTFMNQWNLKGEFADIQKLIGQAQTEHYIIIGLLCVVSIIGIITLWNQRKIKKMLRELMEERKKEEEK